MKAIIDNFKFLLIEVEDQVNLTFKLLNEFDVALFEQIAAKDDYIDNLKTIIENSCFSRIHDKEPIKPKMIDMIHSIHVICVNLERIADYCVNVARQTDYLTHYSFIQKYNYKEMFEEIQKNLSAIIPVFNKSDMAGALDICRAEFNIDIQYKETFNRIMEEIRSGSNIENLITTIFIFRYLERIGDSLLNIGEALLFAITGDRIKIRQFEALQNTLTSSGMDADLEEVDLNSILGSRSGCHLSRIDNKRSSDYKSQSIFKEGDIDKIKKEKENILKWESIYPDLPPRIFGYNEKNHKASLLVEFLSGSTIEELILTADQALLSSALSELEAVIFTVWKQTEKSNSKRSDYMNQLITRINSILQVHPNFNRTPIQLNSYSIMSSEELIKTCARIEKDIHCPFTVFIHGDFNLNNIVYNATTNTINYIDFYRSKDADYIQDVSVFLISNFRLPVFKNKIRDRLNYIISRFYHFFKTFAKEKKDDTFEIRMALALARSLYTSSRFEMNYMFAKEMYLRSHYLLEKVSSFKTKDPKTFHLPTDILYY
ncbi:MAG: phosphotransferase [Desulfobacterales bacterium]|nr:phosphotransferase [Desulfobacterales bacterium]